MAFNQLLSEFIANRKPEQRRKAIITQEDYDLIIKILKNPEDSSIGTANDRFWAKNNFRLCDLGTLQNPILQIVKKKHQRDQIVPTSHTPYELVFGQHPLRRFNMIEELKQHNITMEEDLSQNMVGSEEDLEETDNDDGLYNDNSDFNHMDNDEQRSISNSSIHLERNNSNMGELENEFYSFEIEERNLYKSADDYTILMQQPIRNNQLTQQNINKNADNHTILIQQTIRNDQQVQQHTQDDNSIADNWEQHIEDKENQEPTNSDFVPYKKRRFSAFQEASNSSTHHDIYRQVANRNLENYRSKMERQMHTKYNIQVESDEC
ncbi:hypothetical protein C2G38_2034517 [Gigaspora rosea]|uniref:Uncharacterized protein n=1 Tax=Gigaspora rosea TaxID=44941 RepID=A0A397VJU2_9GLOM|nr:hypothetical protein C2G38_2034517 [Gigaspora rosea]